VTAKKLFNIRAGWTPGEDVLPARFITETCAEDNATKLHEKSLHNAISRYNESRGWTTDGWPAKQCLDDLGLSQFHSPLA
jgi:aldehyde:ferredoxin oxidoreductase